MNSKHLLFGVVRTLGIALCCVLLPALVGTDGVEAREKRTAAMAAANAAKSDFATQGSGRSTASARELPSRLRRFEARVESLPGDGTALLLSEEGPGGGRWRAQVDLQGIPLVAQKRREFEGRKELVPEDLSIGRRLRITWRPDDGEILEIKVLKIRS